MKVWGKGPPRGSDVYVTRAEGSPAPSVLQQHHGSGLACGSEALRLFPALVSGARPLSHFPATWAGLGWAWLVNNLTSPQWELKVTQVDACRLATR